jgi:acetyltransferase-like isoleucine patch superfamily enzyme
MGLRTYARKAQNGWYWWMDKLNKQAYIRKYPKYLRKLGVRINERPGDCWISPTIFLDSAGYDMIEIGDDCTISFDVTILVHDYSINNAFRLVGIPEAEKHRLIKRPVRIGNNCFIGAKAIIMPGAVIGDDCIIGSGAVVRGHIPAGSIVSGNPATVIAKTEDFAKKHAEYKDYELDFR